MSNRVKLSTQMKDKYILSEALTALSIKNEVTSNASVVNYYNNEVANNAEVVVSKYVGFARNEQGNFELVGDVHYEKGLLRKSDAIKKIEQVYKVVGVSRSLNEAGFHVSDYKSLVNSEEIEVTAEVTV